MRRALARAIASLSDRARSRVVLGAHVGPGVRLLGRPSVVSQGVLVVGARATIVSRPAPVTIVVSRGASVEIGENALVESGAVIRASGPVVIGRGVRVGVGCVIDGSELVIPDGEWLADGTIVTGEWERTKKKARAHDHADATAKRVRDVVCEIVPRASELDDASDLRSVSQFDSLAALRVLVALEKDLGIELPHDLFTRPRTIESLAAIARGEETP